MMARLSARAVACPVCGAPAGEPCRGSVTGASRGRPVDSHHARRQLAREQAAP